MVPGLAGSPPGADRIADTRKLADRLGVTVLLKGNVTVVAAPGGAVTSDRFPCPSGPAPERLTRSACGTADPMFTASPRFSFSTLQLLHASGRRHAGSAMRRPSA